MTIPTEVAAVLAEMRAYLPSYLTKGWADRIESALTKAEAVAEVAETTARSGSPLDRPVKYLKELSSYQRLPIGTKLYAHAAPAVQSEQVIDLLLAGGFIDKDKLRVAREIIADCKKPAVPVASVPEGWAPTDDEIDALTDHLYRSLRGTGAHNGGMVGVAWNRALFRKALQVAAREDAAGVVPDGWRDLAASWLESKAAEQEINNRRWPAHADAYPSWRERPGAYRMLARELRSATPPTNQEGAAP